MKKLYIILVTFSFLSISANAETIQGKVIGVMDGDTIKILTSDKKQVKIRLAQIDAPEKSQDYGQKAKQALSDLVFKKQVRVEKETIGKYGRVIGKVYVNGLYVNAELVKQGYAWVYVKYAKDQNLFTYEKQARSAKRGLWSDPNAIPPWEYREDKKSSRHSGKSQVTGKDFTCGSKRYCKEMVSCDEAVFYLKKCGLTRLDGDKDGIPCESLCR